MPHSGIRLWGHTPVPRGRGLQSLSACAFARRNACRLRMPPTHAAYALPAGLASGPTSVKMGVCPGVGLGLVPSWRASACNSRKCEGGPPDKTPPRPFHRRTHCRAIPPSLSPGTHLLLLLGRRGQRRRRRPVSAGVGGRHRGPPRPRRGAPLRGGRGHRPLRRSLAAAARQVAGKVERVSRVESGTTIYAVVVPGINANKASFGGMD